MKEEKTLPELTDDQLENIVGFFGTLRKIHNRLVREGYKFKGDEIIPPEKVPTKEVDDKI
ncbi:MAG TPA: hypothetical protein VFD16_03765 [Candidatus Saccharimonadales bacterium]|nr:hypothetical protein [Candidatus Saccharimonadales bacterium]